MMGRPAPQSGNAMLTIDGEEVCGDTWELVKAELCAGWHVQAALAAGRQRRIAEANARLEHASIEGVGQHVASIDAFAFLDWERRNPGITRDPGWLKSLLRDNPECRVEYTPRRTTVAMPMTFRPSEPSGVCPETGERKAETGKQRTEDRGRNDRALWGMGENTGIFPGGSKISEFEKAGAV